jgi:hypothetical protein
VVAANVLNKQSRTPDKGWLFGLELGEGLTTDLKHVTCYGIYQRASGLGRHKQRPEGKRSLGRTRRRWEDNIKMGLQEVGWGAWTGLIWLRIGTGGGLL